MIDYSKILTGQVKRHIQMSVTAAKADGKDCAYIEADRITSLFCDKLTPKEYAEFDQVQAENVLFSYLDSIFN
jgi:nicotinamide riboside kinase